MIAGKYFSDKLNVGLSYGLV